MCRKEGGEKEANCVGRVMKVYRGKVTKVCKKEVGGREAGCSGGAGSSESKGDQGVRRKGVGEGAF